MKDSLAFLGLVLTAICGLAPAVQTSHAQAVISAPPTVIADGYQLSPGDSLNVGPGGQVGHGVGIFEGSVVNITGGDVGLRLLANEGSEVNISAGNVGNFSNAGISSLEARAGSVVNLSGGIVGVRFSAWSDSEVNITGGTLGRELRFETGSKVALFGGDFRLNGDLYSEGDIVLTSSIEGESVFTGTLSDGSPFIFSSLGRARGDQIEGLALTQVVVPPVDLTPKVVSSPVTDGPFGVRTGQMMTVVDGGELPNHFAVVEGTLNVDGGAVGHGLEVANSVVNISDGEVGSFFYAYSGSEVNVSGGTIYSRFEAFNTNFNVSGGTLGSSNLVHEGSSLSVTGGDLGTTHAYGGSTVHLSGGTIGSSGFGSLVANAGSDVTISGGAVGGGFMAKSDSSVELVGGDFRLNDIEFVDDRISLSAEDVLTGTLADGSAFVFSPMSGDDLKEVSLSRVPVPKIDLMPIIVDGPRLDEPFGIRAGQSLTVQQGGQLPTFFAVVDATLNVEGGMVGAGLEVYKGEINISGGAVGRELIAGPNGSGDFSGGLNALDSVVNLSGGILGDDSLAGPGSVVNISGGVVGYRFAAVAGSRVSISGGAIGQNFEAAAGSDVELVGGEFVLNGTEFFGSSISLGSEDVFSGTLADGSTFVFSPLSGRFLGDLVDSLTLRRVALPERDPAPMFLNSQISEGPSGLRSGQTLTVQNGGELRDFFSVVDATLNIEGGIVGRGLEVTDGRVNVHGGEVGANFWVSNSEVSISGGTVNQRLTVHPHSKVDISGGNVGNIFLTYDSILSISGASTTINGVSILAGSELNLLSGTLVYSLISNGAQVNISGGYVGGTFSSNGVDNMANISGGVLDGPNFYHYAGTVNISGGTISGEFSARSDSMTNLFGKYFLLDGVPLSGLAEGEAFTITDRDVTLSGILSDGTPFSFDLNSQRNLGDYFDPEAILTVTLVVPEPSSWALLAALCCLLVCGRRLRGVGR